MHVLSKQARKSDLKSARNGTCKKHVTTTFLKHLKG